MGKSAPKSHHVGSLVVVQMKLVHYQENIFFAVSQVVNAVTTIDEILSPVFLDPLTVVVEVVRLLRRLGTTLRLVSAMRFL